MTATDDDPAGPLDGLRVIDFSGMISGGYATMVLADFGADVVFAEHPDSHDPIRDWTPFENGTSLWWKSLGRNKRCVTLDLHTDEGRALALELVEDADAVVENFRAGTLERWDLGPETLRDANEELIVVRISGYGQTGPKATEPGFGTVAEAMSGFAHVNGFPDREPLLPPISLADMAAAQTAVQSLLMAVFERDVAGSGKGQVVDVSLLESLFRMFPGDVEKYDKQGAVSERIGNHHTNAAPRNVYETRDGYVALSASAQSIFENLAEIIDHPELVEDPRFEDNKSRVANADELDEYIAPWIAERSTERVLDELRAGDAVVAPIYDMSDVFEDEQYDARNDIVEVDDPEVGPIKTQNTLPKFSRTPGRVDHLGPEHGEHNHEVYVDELGLDEETVAKLRDDGVI
ncbi:CaiB/BaiF CoA transferase family protein [Halorientalis brevis]|uniref:CaiB/BaiF CoA transferase family protein n=1 Tax=Halorientalis brevis TaxID=1126241 RepID=A0ABD6CGK1_9EURY|nr:CoA transferase [Halorientalis brevis]